MRNRREEEKEEDKEKEEEEEKEEDKTCSYDIGRGRAQRLTVILRYLSL